MVRAPEGSRWPQGTGKRGSRTGLLAVIVRMKQDRTFEAAIHGLRHATDDFGPAERLFDPLAVFLGQSAAFLPGGAAVSR